MNYYELHLGDYAKDAGHLSMLEDGAYRRLLDAYYGRERPLPPELRECCKLARAATKPERDAVAYVLREFFDLQDDGYHQKRADDEIAKFQESEPDRAAKRENSKERVRRHRERRKALFEELRELDIVPHYETTNAELERMLSRATKREVTEPVTRYETANHTHFPVTKNPQEQKQDQDQKIGRSQGSRLPPAWTLPEDWRTWAQTERPDVDADREAAQFADYWHGKPGKDGRKADWQATWRNWIRRSNASRGVSRETPLPRLEA